MVFRLFPNGLWTSGKGSNNKGRPTYPFRELLSTEDREEMDQEWNELLNSVDDLNESLNQ